MKRTFYTILILLNFATPALALAAPAPALDYSGFVKCDGVVKKDESGRTNECNFAWLIKTIKYAINWLFIFSIPIATALVAYAGILYMTGVQKNIGTAKSIFTSVITGFIIMISAWFVVRQAVSWFVEDPTATTFLGK